jgi:hypothetical protein
MPALLPGAQLSSNFGHRGQISYSYHNMAGGPPQPVVAAEFALMADRNPNFEHRDSSGRYRASSDNSHNHAGAGQSVLYRDGRVAWRNTCAAGPRSDNIWTLANAQITTYVGTERPTSRDDSFLVP